MGKNRIMGFLVYWAIARITAGPPITANNTGRKNTIIGTVSLAGSDAAFFSAADIRASRFSCDRTRRPSATGVPYFSDWIRVVERDLIAGNPVRSARFSS